MQNLKNTKAFANFSGFKTKNVKNINNFITPNSENPKTTPKDDLPSRRTDDYRQYKELKLFKQMSNEQLNTKESVQNTDYPSRDTNMRTLRNTASHSILGNGSFVRSNNLKNIRLDTDYSRNDLKPNKSIFKENTQRVRFQEPGNY
jgi:hypothetical protein